MSRWLLTLVFSFSTSALACQLHGNQMAHDEFSYTIDSYRSYHNYKAPKALYGAKKTIDSTKLEETKKKKKPAPFFKFKRVQKTAQAGAQVAAEKKQAKDKAAAATKTVQSPTN